MLVYRPSTSRLKRKDPFGTFPILEIFKRKSFVSLIYDGNLCDIGFKKKSTNDEIFSVGQPFPETIGLPGGGILFYEFLVTCKT